MSDDEGHALTTLAQKLAPRAAAQWNCGLLHQDLTQLDNNQSPVYGAVARISLSNVGACQANFSGTRFCPSDGAFDPTSNGERCLLRSEGGIPIMAPMTRPAAHSYAQCVSPTYWASGPVPDDPVS